MNSLVFQPLIPIAVWLSLVLAALVLMSWYGRDCSRRLGAGFATRVVVLMTLSIGLPLAILLNPTWHERLPPPEGKPVMTVLLDASTSMSTQDAAGGSSRFQEAGRIAESLSKRLADRFDVQLQTFAGVSSPIEATRLAGVTPDGPITDLAGSLAQVLQVDKPQGQVVVLLSDGIHNAGGGDAAVLETAQRAKALSAPIYPMTLGRDAEVRDLAVEVHSPQDLAFVGQKISSRVALVSHGLAGGVARVSLRLDDREVEQREVALSDDRSNEVEFWLTHDHSGIFHYEIRVDPFAAEATDANNRCTYVLRVIDEPIRVLLLEGRPYWDTKFLVRTLTFDPSIELVSLVRMAEGRFLERALGRPAAPANASEALQVPVDTAPDAGRPVSNAPTALPGGSPGALQRTESWKIRSSVSEVFHGEQPLGKYQIVVLGRDADIYLTDNVLTQLKRWLSIDGGSLVCFRGTPSAQVSQRLGALLPVASTATRETRFHVKLTDVGRELRWIGGGDVDDPLTRMPTLATRSQSNAQPLAVVWAIGESPGRDSSPVVTAMPYGTGRVVVLEGAGMWRWAFLAPQYQKHEQIYGAIWQSLIRWLVSNTGLLPSQTWSLRSDKVRFGTREQATASLLVRPSAVAGGPPQIELSSDELDAPRLLTPVALGDDVGAYRIAFGKLPEGSYRASVIGSAAGDSAAQTVFEVRNNLDEMLRLTANRNLMTRLAADSGGEVLESGSPEEVSTKIEEHFARTRPEQIRRTTAWDRWWVLTSVFVFWAITWGLRRTRGLV